MPETRKHERLPISIRVRFRSATLDEFVEKYAQNISHGGLFIQSRSPMPIGTLIKFEFRLTDESKLISGVGRIVWSRTEGNDEEAPSGMGIKFIKVDPESRERITSIVDQRGGGEGMYEEEEGAPLSEPPLMPTAPPKGLAGGSSPPPGYQVRHPELHGLSDSDTIHAPQRPEDAGSEKSPREARPSLAAALMNTEDAISVSTSRSESMPAGLAPDQQTDARVSNPPAASEPPLSLSEPPAASEPPLSFSEPPAASEPPLSFSEPPADSSPAPAPTSKHPAVTGETLDGIPDPSFAEQTDKADPFARPTSKTGISAIESALADSLDDEQQDEPPATDQGLLLQGAQDSAFGIGADAPEGSAMEGPLSSPSEPASPPAKQSRLMPTILAIVLLALVGAMLFFWFNQGSLGGDSAPEDSSTSDTTSAPEKPAPVVTPTTASDAGNTTGDSGEGDAQTQSADASVPEDAKLIKTSFMSNVRGAEFRYGSTTFDKQVELPEGVEVTVSASAPGYKSTTHTFVPGPSNQRQRVTLEPLPHVVKVTSDPPGATIVISGKKAEAPAEITFDGSPGAAFVVATLPGHVRQRVRLDAKAFEQVGEQMEQSISLTLKPRPKPRPRPAGGGDSSGASSGDDSSGGASSGGGSTGGGSTGGAGDVPDNPF